MRIKLLLIILILTGTLIVSAQTKTFKWSWDLCEFEGEYDSTKYSETQLNDTRRLVDSIGSLSLAAETTVWKIEDIETINTKKLDKEYIETLAKLASLNVIKTNYWQNLHQAKIKELKKYYALSKVTINAYKNPSVLKDYKGAEFCVDFYAEPLKRGGEYLYATWLKVNMDSRLRNASPLRLQNKFDIQNASANRSKYARMEVMGFGWWNCAIKASRILEHNEQLIQNFNKLFTKVKQECDEP